MNPAGGAGAQSAIHDAVCLANWLNVLPSLSVKDLEATFKEYHSERYPIVMAAFRASSALAKSSEKNIAGAIIRYINSHMPKWLWAIFLKKMNAYRPQVSFLDLAEDTGTVRPNGQSSLIKTRMLMEALLKKQQQQKPPSPSPSSTPVAEPIPV